MKALTLALLLGALACASAGSYAIYNTAFQETAGSEVFNFQRVHPGQTHLGVWRDVADCLDITAPRPAWDIYWAIADSIRTDDGLLAYGMTEILDGAAVGIIIERDFWFNTAVISHETIHAISGEMDHEGPEWTCVMPIGVPLPERRSSR